MLYGNHNAVEALAGAGVALSCSEKSVEGVLIFVRRGAIVICDDALRR